jgi:hypothetical protein
MVNGTTIDEVVAAAQPFRLIDQIPPSLSPWLLPIEWDLHKLWALDGLEEREIAVDELRWQLDLPWWRDDSATLSPWFRIRPVELLADPMRCPDQYERIARTDLSFPVHVIERHGRWFILDGVHRLAKAATIGLSHVRVLIVTPGDLAKIAIRAW